MQYTIGEYDMILRRKESHMVARIMEMFLKEVLCEIGLDM